MAAIAVHKFVQCITCHTWSPDHSTVNRSSALRNQYHCNWNWNIGLTPQQVINHDQIVSGIDWSARSNGIVIASLDQNSYVWNLEGSERVPTLVILRLNGAALCVQWSPKENKFAVGSGAKTVCICYYKQENNWWVSELVRKRHDSSMTSVAWHPNNFYWIIKKATIAARCLFNTCNRRFFLQRHLQMENDRDSTKGASSDLKFGELIVQLDLSLSWAFGVKWSLSSNTLAYVGHNSMIYFADDIGPSPLAQNVTFHDLPLRDVLFISEKMVVGVGFDCFPMVFAADGREYGVSSDFFVKRKQHLLVQAIAHRQIQFSEAFGKFYGQSKHGVNDDAVEPWRTCRDIHDNCITCIVPLKENGTWTRRFSTSGLDGKIVFWDLENQQNLSEYIEISEIEIHLYFYNRESIVAVTCG